MFLKQVEDKFKPFFETAEATKKQKELDSWAANEWSSLEKDQEVQSDLKKIGRTLDKEVQSEISGVIQKYLPTDESGSLSVRKGYEIWKEIKGAKVIAKPNPSVEEKKKIADATTNKSIVSEEPKSFKTSSDFRGKSFADLSR